MSSRAVEMCLVVSYRDGRDKPQFYKLDPTTLVGHNWTYKRCEASVFPWWEACSRAEKHRSLMAGFGDYNPADVVVVPVRKCPDEPEHWIVIVEHDNGGDWYRIRSDLYGGRRQGFASFGSREKATKFHSEDAAHAEAWKLSERRRSNPNIKSGHSRVVVEDSTGRRVPARNPSYRAPGPTIVETDLPFTDADRERLSDMVADMLRDAKGVTVTKQGWGDEVTTVVRIFHREGA